LDHIVAKIIHHKLVDGVKWNIRNFFIIHGCLSLLYVSGRIIHRLPLWYILVPTSLETNYLPYLQPGEEYLPSMLCFFE
jgi:hypothetical protein